MENIDIPILAHPAATMGLYYGSYDGIPPLRQRHRNDGLTNDTRSEVSYSHNPSFQQVNLWWIGRPGNRYYGST